jgi:hypothetical protein
VQPSTPGNLPSSASIDMPPVTVHAVFLQHDPKSGISMEQDHPSDGLAEGLTVREGNYLRATADVGSFEHILTTDLLNHLVFVQKVFMKVCFFGIVRKILLHFINGMYLYSIVVN